MLVYGDPQFETTLAQARAQLENTLAQCWTGDLDALRALLIQAGQIEQGVQDHCTAELELTSQCERLTEYAAAAFYHAWAEGDPGLPKPPVSITPALAQCELELAGLATADPKPLVLKVPEGFEFYALYPEQYAAAAVQWAKEHISAPDRSVLVIGLRSIGTTLSAMVSVTLQAAGWTVCRGTIRPKGAPFQRNVDLNSLGELSAKWAIIVDEGPGLSGSSLVGAAQALVAGGFNLGRLAIFPGHEGEPGAAATPDIRHCWNSLKRYFVPLKEIRWDGRSLLASLAANSMQGRVEDSPPNLIDDLSGGLWRRFAYEQTEDWPAVAAPFERMKWRVKLETGASVVWKFTGLGAMVQASCRGDACIRQQLADGAARKFCPDVLGSFRGFVAQPWVEGKRLSARDADPEILRHLARYLVAAAGLPLTSSEQEAAMSRLAEMLFWNMKKSFGDAYAEPIYQVSDIVPQVAGLPTYGDGRMAPHEWVRTASGDIFKVDSAGHTFDHTLVGRQSIAWDIAGVLVEWGLDGTNSALLLKELEQGGIRVPMRALQFYKQAYAAFRLGQMKLCGSDNVNQSITRAADFYAQAALAVCA